ncbi:sortase [Helicobacter pylori]|nr:sortase [Helicobacter pylori]WRA99043.1 sortase [Helicobacter pylori]
MLAPIESINQALVRLGKKKLHVLNHSVSNFLDHFHQLKGHEFVISNIDMQNIQEQVLETLMGGGLAAGSMALIGGVGAAPVIAILGALSAAKMEKKLEDAKAYCSQVEAAVKKADVVIDNLQAVRKMADLFTRQITKFDALFFSLSQEAIATMRKHNYDTSRYNQKEKDQLSVTVSTLMTLSAFLKVPIMDEHQKLTEKAKNALILMRDQMDSLKNGNYSLDGIGFRQARLEDLRDDKTS